MGVAAASRLARIRHPVGMCTTPAATGRIAGKVRLLHYVMVSTTVDRQKRVLTQSCDDCVLVHSLSGVTKRYLCVECVAYGGEDKARAA